MKKLIFLFLLIISANMTAQYTPSYYALIISDGRYGLPPEGKPPYVDYDNAFWCDAFKLWQFCKPYYSNILFLYRLGSDPPIEEIDEYNYLDPEGITDYPATKSYIISVCSTLATQMHYYDVLVVYIKAHGYYENGSGYFQLNNNGQEKIYDYDFESWIKNIPCKKRIIINSACRSGAFKDNFNDYKTIFISASDYDEDALFCDDLYMDGGDDEENNEYVHELKWSAHGEFDYHMLNALRQTTVDENNYIESDLNGDLAISISEMFDWATNTIHRNQTPQYYDFNNLGNRTYIYPIADRLWQNTLVLSNGTTSSSPYLVWGENQDLSGGITKYKIYRQISECEVSPEGGSEVWIGTTSSTNF